MSQLIPSEVIEQRILLIREQKVLLSTTLAELYNVEPRVLMQAVKRNSKRFPGDFRFQLTPEEFNNLKSQFVISKRGGIRKLPYAFTEQGVAMLSSVLHSNRAIEVNIAIMRAFVKLREILSTHKDLVKKLEDLERKFESHDKHIKIVFDALPQLMAEPKKKKYNVGF
ncbi:MAG: ORF6N domain-containing protein [Bacteroidetes bacterium]|nr:ORF6N domain-containing protein [Bacteroidota bacterium]